MNKTYDVIVVGGGHAGLEAALAAVRLGQTTALATFRADQIAEMSCNPAIGGVAKGQLTREVDALGGAQGYLIDQAMIHFRMLNRSKGPAVQSPRAQADRTCYTRFASELAGRTSGLDILEGEITDLILDRDSHFESGWRVIGVRFFDGREFGCRAAVLCTGTFLKGLLHEGERKTIGGRVGDPSAEGLSTSLACLNLRLGRLKTGTPARLNRHTIDWERLEQQPSEPLDYQFSHWWKTPPTRLVEEGVHCSITFTNEQTHHLIRQNFHRAPLFSGDIKGVGPRYCPSIEDKVHRFPEKPRHQVFLEPDGLNTDLIYPNGIPTSLPADVQVDFIHTIPGLEQANVVQPGYAVEYDYVDPTELSPSLATKTTPNLFLAGQINGTSGYEEAAGQGLIAGTNAARYLLGLSPLILRRDEAYIGVLIDDLVTRGASEPYRMFTSRAEYRLLLRQDNADLRLTQRAREYGLIGEAQTEQVEQLQQAVQLELDRLYQTRVAPKTEIRQLVESLSPGAYKKPGTLADVLERNGIRYHHIREIEQVAGWDVPGDSKTTDDYQSDLTKQRLAEQVEITIKYRGYLDRQLRQIEEQRRMDGNPLPDNLDYANLEGMRAEARQKLATVRPITLGQAARVQGVSPADIAVLMAQLKKVAR